MEYHTDDIISLAVHDLERRAGSSSMSVAATGEVGRMPKIVVWDTSTMDVKAVLKGYHRRGVTKLAFSGDGTFLATIGLDDRNSIAVYIGDDSCAERDLWEPGARVQFHPW